MEGGERNSDRSRRRRLTLWDQMSAVEGAVTRDSITLSDILRTTDKQPSSAAAEPQPQVRHSNRTLLDVIREQDPNAARSAYKGLNINTNNNRDKKSWKTFKDKLRLKRAGAAWTSSVPIPTSDIPIQQQGSLSRRNSVRFRSSAELTQSSEDDLSRPPQISRRNSTRYSPGDLIPVESTHFPDSESSSFAPQVARHNSTRFVGTPHPRNTEISSSSSSSSSDEDDDEEEGDDEIAPHTPTRRLSVVLAEERALSAREAVAAQEAAEAERERQEQLNSSSTTTTAAAEPQVRMSLMDLMDYNMDEEEEEEEDNERNEGKGKEEEVAEENGGGSGSKRGEYKCCVCMVRHKGSAFIPCGHTFCRLCSRELMVSRGNCPLCNRFILEILDIF